MSSSSGSNHESDDISVTKEDRETAATTLEDPPDESSSSTTTTTVENEEWIPPNRPLAGDQGYHGINPEEDDDDIDDGMVDAQKLVDDALFQISDDQTQNR